MEAYIKSPLHLHHSLEHHITPHILHDPITNPPKDSSTLYLLHYIAPQNPHVTKTPTTNMTGDLSIMADKPARSSASQYISSFLHFGGMHESSLLKDFSGAGTTLMLPYCASNIDERKEFVVAALLFQELHCSSLISLSWYRVVM